MRRGQRRGDLAVMPRLLWGGARVGNLGIMHEMALEPTCRIGGKIVTESGMFGWGRRLKHRQGSAFGTFRLDVSVKMGDEVEGDGG